MCEMLRRGTRGVLTWASMQGDLSEEVETPLGVSKGKLELWGKVGQMEQYMQRWREGTIKNLGKQVSGGKITKKQKALYTHI